MTCCFSRLAWKYGGYPAEPPPNTACEYMPGLPCAAELRKLAVRAIGMGSDQMLDKLLPADRDRTPTRKRARYRDVHEAIVGADAVLAHTGHQVGLE